MTNAMAIAIGGAIGALARYWMSLWVHGIMGRDFPWGTLTINVVGSLLIGLLHVVLVERLNLPPAPWRALLMVGVLGAFTTFSSFSLETLILFEGGAWLKALLNIVISVTLCLAAAGAGLFIGRQI